MQSLAPNVQVNLGVVELELLFCVLDVESSYHAAQKTNNKGPCRSSLARLLAGGLVPAAAVGLGVGRGAFVVVFVVVLLGVGVDPVKGTGRRLR